MGTKGVGERARLKVLYDFEYETRGKRVRIVKDEPLLLLKRTNDDWWQVARPNDLVGSSSFFVPEQATFYVPTGYVTEIQEEPLSDGTRFYVDKDKMFKSSETPAQATSTGTTTSNSSTSSSSSSAGGAAAASPAPAGQQLSAGQDAKPKEESRKVHDSFRDVMRKLSVNLPSFNDSNKPAKPAKTSKSQRKNSMDNGEEAKVPSGAKSILGIVPAKHKDNWESSTFGMCFGKDMKNADAQLLNPFQEELANKVILKKTVLDNKVEVSNKHMDQVSEESECSNFENIHSKWEKVSAAVSKKPDSFKRPDNFQFVSLAKIKEDAQKRRSVVPNFQKNDGTTSTNNDAKVPSQNDKVYSVVEKGPRKPLQTSDKNANAAGVAPGKPAEKATAEKSSKPVDTPLAEKPGKPVNTRVPDKMTNAPEAPVSEAKQLVGGGEESPSKEKDRQLINDKRKMWAIETLMSELMQSSSSSGPKSLAASTNSGDRSMSGPSQLAQELHEMNRSRRYENAEIQVNLLEKEAEPIYRASNSFSKRKAFDFPPRGGTPAAARPARSPSARSPKLLDEYNEANILNDNERMRRSEPPPAAVPLSYDDEPPSYSNVALRIRRGDKVPCPLKMPSRDFREELQLTPSLERLASEIKFLPANAAAAAEIQLGEQDRPGLDIDCPSTTLSQDSLRLYKRRSKSDGALNKRDPRRRDSSAGGGGGGAGLAARGPGGALSHTDIFPSGGGQAPPAQQPLVVERKYARWHHQEAGTGDRARYNRLERKSRSLGDLDCPDELGSQARREDGEAEARRRYKPVPKLRSKESLRRLRQSPLTTTASAERLTGRPVPAKRRIPPSQQQQQQMCDSSYDELSEIDIERSTAVGFKSLLRTSDSGSEEYLQYKTFPASSRPPIQQQQTQQQPQLHSTPKLGAPIISRSDGNVSLSRSLSDEMILSSTSCSSASPSRIRPDSSLENLVELPAGWTQSYDHNAKRVCFLNERGDKWFSSNDQEGKIYFFEENSNESSWALPVTVNENRVRTVSNGDWPQLFDGNMCILKEGTINKTKITTENGKKLRKAWSASYAVLTELFLLFFKDAKTFAAMKMDPTAAAKPDISIDLNGAFIESGEKLSNRKNVYLINTLLGLQVLVQSDNALVIAEWYRAIHDAIQRLPFSQEYGRSSSSRE